MWNAFVGSLRDAGLDVVTVADVDRLGAADAEQLAWATDQGGVCIRSMLKTSAFNRSFGNQVSRHNYWHWTVRSFIWIQV